MATTNKEATPAENELQDREETLPAPEGDNQDAAAGAAEYLQGFRLHAVVFALLMSMFLVCARAPYTGWAGQY